MSTKRNARAERTSTKRDRGSKTPPAESPLHARIKDRYGSISAYATRVGVNRRHVYAILGGASSPTLQLASRLAYNLGLTLDEFNAMLPPASAA